MYNVTAIVAVKISSRGPRPAAPRSAPQPRHQDMINVTSASLASFSDPLLSPSYSCHLIRTDLTAAPPPQLTASWNLLAFLYLNLESFLTLEDICRHAIMAYSFIGWQ